MELLLVTLLLMLFPCIAIGNATVINDFGPVVKYYENMFSDKTSLASRTYAYIDIDNIFSDVNFFNSIVLYELVEGGSFRIAERIYDWFNHSIAQRRKCSKFIPKYETERINHSIGEMKKYLQYLNIERLNHSKSSRLNDDRFQHRSCYVAYYSQTIRDLSIFEWSYEIHAETCLVEFKDYVLEPINEKDIKHFLKGFIEFTIRHQHLQSLTFKCENLVSEVSLFNLSPEVLSILGVLGDSVMDASVYTTTRTDLVQSLLALVVNSRFIVMKKLKYLLPIHNLTWTCVLTTRQYARFFTSEFKSKVVIYLDDSTEGKPVETEKYVPRVRQQRVNGWLLIPMENFDEKDANSETPAWISKKTDLEKHDEAIKGILIRLMSLSANGRLTLDHLDFFKLFGRGVPYIPFWANRKEAFYQFPLLEDDSTKRWLEVKYTIVKAVTSRIGETQTT